MIVTQLFHNFIFKNVPQFLKFSKIMHIYICGTLNVLLEHIIQFTSYHVPYTFLKYNEFYICDVAKGVT